MVIISPCECVNPDYPTIETIDAPDFGSIDEFETWLRTEYIPRTQGIEYWENPETGLPINIKQTECWGIFSPDNVFLKCCQTYSKTHLTSECEGYLQGNILSHNHPSNDTLSLFDICIGAILQMKEIRAVTQIYTYRVRPLNEVWPEPNLLLGRIKTICPSIILNGAPRSMGDSRHRCFQTLSRDGCFIYERL